jgi:hypothetical protein
MKLHTASKYLLSLPKEAEKGSRARFSSLRDAVFCAFGFDPTDSVLLAALGEEHSYVCRAVSSSLMHAGYRVAVVNADPLCPPEEMVKVCGERVGDDVISEVITEVRKSAKSLGVVPTAFEAGLICRLVLCRLSECKNVILGLDPAAVPKEDCALVPFSKTVVLLPSEMGVAGGRAAVRRGTLEVISAPRGEDEYRSASAICAAVNCRHSVIAKGIVKLQNFSYKGILFSYKDHEYLLSGHSESMLMNASAAVQAVRSLERQGLNVSEADVQATLPDIVSECGCKVVSYNPCVISAVCRSDGQAGRFLKDAEAICARLNKNICVFSEFSGENALERIFECGLDENIALCVEGREEFVRKALAEISVKIFRT